MTQSSSYQGVGKVAEYCGVSRQNVHDWIRRHGVGSESATPMPLPAVSIETAQRGYLHHGWSTSQLKDIRAWAESLPGRKKITSN
jgi:hypothetical protein